MLWDPGSSGSSGSAYCGNAKIDQNGSDLFRSYVTAIPLRRFRVWKLKVGDQAVSYKSQLLVISTGTTLSTVLFFFTLQFPHEQQVQLNVNDILP